VGVSYASRLTVYHYRLINSRRVSVEKDTPLRDHAPL